MWYGIQEEYSNWQLCEDTKLDANISMDEAEEMITYIRKLSRQTETEESKTCVSNYRDARTFLDGTSSPVAK